MVVSRIVLVLAMVTVIAACGPSAQEATPTIAIDCDPMRWDPPARLTCEAAMNAAAGKVLTLGRGPIVAASFRYGPWCPPNARCVGPIPDRGYVVFRFDDGLEDLMVDVAVTGGILSAGDPQAVPDVGLPDPPAP
jgi:hypothetical protein